MSSAPSGESRPRLKRELGLWALVFYGIVMIQPTAPMPLFGVVSQVSRGHMILTLAISMCAMMLTALSYGRMAAVHPSAGSVYTYVSREIHAGAGFVTGWCTMLSYLFNPIISAIWCAKAAVNVTPEISFYIWLVFFALTFTAMNLMGIRTSARTTEALVLTMFAVIAAFFVAAARYVMHLPGMDAAYLARPMYDAASFDWHAVATGTSIAVLTFIGFDGISTLAEEAHNPRRNVLLATVLTCFITGVLSILQVYAGQLVWPDYTKFPDVDTAFSFVAGRAGGHVMFHVLNFTLLVAQFGSGMGAQLSAVRLLYGMGRDNAIPRRFFGAIDLRRHIPRNNVLLTGALTLIGGFAVSFQLGSELLNFGALIGFMGVNAAAFVCAGRNWMLRSAAALGFLICLGAWASLRPPVLIAGGVWMAAGIVYGAWKTGGFRRKIEFAEAPLE
ncbi:MAG TPA: APC family permease [Bryobacteraceae bacterium]|nr:APC family permease [Bryobacteraceae bacterium]